MRGVNPDLFDRGICHQSSQGAKFIPYFTLDTAFNDALYLAHMASKLQVEFDLPILKSDWG